MKGVSAPRPMLLYNHFFGRATLTLLLLMVSIPFVSGQISIIPKNITPDIAGFREAKSGKFFPGPSGRSAAAARQADSVCRRCGKVNSHDAAYCGGCGLKLRSFVRGGRG